MGKIETVCKILEGDGLKPSIEDGRILVRYEMKRLIISLSDDEDVEHPDKYVNVAYPYFYDVDEGEIPDMLVLCNKANRELRQIKTFLSEDLNTVSSSFEFWYHDDDDLANSIHYALYMISHIRAWFMSELRKLQTSTDNPTESEMDDNSEEKNDD